MSDTQKRFQKTLRQVESSDRTKLIPEYVNPKYGQAAGAYQLTPATVQSLPQRLKNKDLPVDPALEALVNAYPEERNQKDYSAITQALNKDPELDERIGSAQAGLELDKYKNDVLRAAYAHHTGQAAPKSLEELTDTPSDPNYIEKFVHQYEHSSPDTNILDREKFGRTRDLFAARDQRLANRIKSGKAFIPKPVIPEPDATPTPEPTEEPEINSDGEVVASNDRFSRLRGRLK